MLYNITIVNQQQIDALNTNATTRKMLQGAQLIIGINTNISLKPATPATLALLEQILEDNK